LSNILNLCANLDFFERFGGLITRDGLTIEENKIYDDLEEYYSSTTIKTIVWDDFAEWFFQVKHPTMKMDDIDLCREILDNLSKMDPPDEAFVTKIMEAFLKRELCGDIANIALPGYEGDDDADIQQIEELIETFYQEMSTVAVSDEAEITQDIEEIMSNQISGGLTFRLKTLNIVLGNLHPKVMMVCCRPNTGKTSFLVSECVHWVDQMEEGQQVLYFNNDDSGADLKVRAACSKLVKTESELAMSITANSKAFKAKTDGKLVFFEIAPMSKQDVESRCKKYNPGVIIIDQLWKVKGFDKRAGNDADMIERQYAWARELTKKYKCPVVVAHQAGDSAEGVDWLTMSDIYKVKTAAQGECDFIVMIGRKHDLAVKDERYFTIVKVRQRAGPDLDKSHPFQFVTILDGERAIFKHL
jgi:replicative DNA helicase